MWELDCEESWASKNWCFWAVVLEKTLESPLDCKEIQPVHPKWDQSWMFIGRTDAKAETPLLWPPHVKSWLIGKDTDAGRDWGQEEKGTTEDEMAGWHHQLNGHESEWTPGVSDGQGGLVCCDLWVAKSRTWLSDWTELNWTEYLLNPLPSLLYLPLLLLFFLSFLMQFVLFCFVFGWAACQVLVIQPRIEPALHPCIWSSQSSPLDYQESPHSCLNWSIYISQLVCVNPFCCCLPSLLLFSHFSPI